MSPVNPKFGYSHVQFVGKIAEILVEEGNEVVQLIIEMDPSIKGNGTEKAKNIIYPGIESVMKRLQNSGKHLNVWKSEHGSMEQLNVIMDIIESNRDVGTQLIYDKELGNWIREQKFDMAISEIFNVYAFGLFKAWDIDTTIAISAIPLVETYRWFYGMDYPASFIPGITMSMNDKMTYKERFINLLNFLLTKLIFDYDKSYDYTEMLQKVYPDRHINNEKECGDVSFLFLNTHPYLDFPQSLPPKIQEIGGIAIPEKKVLSKEWDDILNKRKINVLLSFGTIVKSKNMPSNVRINIVNTFLSFKNVTFIWKVDKDDDYLDKNYDNIIVKSWIPQSDLLADDRLYLFITHCGLNSFMELTYNGKVALAIPFLADQFRNSKLLAKAGSGKAIDKKDLDYGEKFTNAIRDMLENNDYKVKALRIKNLIETRPLESKEVFLKHIEIAKKFKKLPELDLSSRNLTFIEYFNLDIFIPAIMVFLLILFTIAIVIKKIIILCFFVKQKSKIE
ncbi:UDP-glucuronosyl/UDP-glucosyltransferase family-containing protein [Strongyloides ratti]|uniref:glucuronosyltransferase n=1 Tax=Strongyloides ratti TaxID=34506 RepID=A0A090L0Q2_STRRB|nr:UDP-glucuronosyl/UDP-glucosyltransferase family-containing protein [Strongyloides ratti]CEF63360.1 UDP-glucuronosyl/UDP-glucosyltransferase family-containing protein [Strongyloides ratti]